MCENFFYRSIACVMYSAGLVLFDFSCTCSDVSMILPMARQSLPMSLNISFVVRFSKAFNVDSEFHGIFRKKDPFAQVL
jgi:hypothetical protein